MVYLLSHYAGKFLLFFVTVENIYHSFSTLGQS